MRFTSEKRPVAALGLALAWLFLATSPSEASCIPFTPQPPGTPADTIIQEFPVNSQVGTAWRVRFGEAADNRGLYIRGAWFRRTPTSNWMRVLWEAKLSEIFVPYHPGQPRIYDVAPWHPLTAVSTAEAGPCGELGPLLTPLPGDPNTAPRPVWVKEMRSYGFSHLKKDKVGSYPPILRRGQQLVVWATQDSENYDYIMEYAFRDDGTIVFRLGATGYNNPGEARTAHVHDALWRIDIDLDGSQQDNVLISDHIEPLFPPTKAEDILRPFNGGFEGFEDWRAKEYTSLVIEDTATQNAYGHNISYELIPMVRGTARHYGPGESFSHHDFWVTRYNGSQVAYENVPSYVDPQQSIQSTDIVVWAMTSAHHHPRDEDFLFPNMAAQGTTSLMWSGFMLRPRNLFDRSPLLP